MNEHSFARKLKTDLAKHEVSYHWKINDPFTNGVPDNFIEGLHADLWLEAKHIKNLPKRSSTMIDITKLLSPLQLHWLNRRHARRADACVLVTTPEGHALLKHEQWNSAFTTDNFRQILVPWPTIIKNIIGRINYAQNPHP